jgi:hypothetical protein
MRDAREGARRLERDHERLGARVHEANLLEGRAARAEMLGVLDLGLGRHHERRAALELLGHGLDDGGKRVPVDERGHVVGEVDARDALEVVRRQPSP